MSLIRIRITLNSPHPPEHPQNGALRAFIRRQHGWELQQSTRRWQAHCHSGEAQDIKARLRRHGFADPDFQIRVEYQRGWGFL